MTWTGACCFAALFIFAYAAQDTKLPSTWKSCKMPNKEERDACLVPVVEEAILSLMKGNPSLGVLPMDPLRFTSLGIEGSGAVAINLTFYDLDIHNLRNLEVKKIDAKWEDYQIDIYLKVKGPLLLKGKYEISGKVLVLPIVGKGDCKLVFDDYEAKLGFSGLEKFDKKIKFYDIQKGTLHFNTTKFSIHFDNLFNGNKALGDNMNKFLNENSLLILEELRNPISGAFGEGFKAIANRIFHKIPMSEYS